MIKKRQFYLRGYTSLLEYHTASESETGDMETTTTTAAAAGSSDLLAAVSSAQSPPVKRKMTHRSCTNVKNITKV